METEKIKTTIIIILIVVVILTIIKLLYDEDFTVEEVKGKLVGEKLSIENIEDIHIINKLQEQIEDILQVSGFHNIKYKLRKHPLNSFTKEKKDINICMDCAEYDDHKMLYISLHEVAHVIVPEKNHTEKWWFVFNTLLDAGQGLGYL